MFTEQEKLGFIANKIKHLTFNKHIVQIIVGDKWYYAYHGVPESGTPEVLYSSKAEAFEAILIQAMNEAIDVKTS